MQNILSLNVRALGVLLLAALLTACGSSPGPRIVTATPNSALVPTRVALASDAGALPPGINPLTGQAVDPAVLNRRPLAVKISNAPDSVRPQAGIGEADLVFEHRVEADLTRFTAIFWTHTPPRVGSVRSARLIDLELMPMYGAVFAYSGASEPIRQRIAAAPFAARAYEGVTTGEPLYYRDPGHRIAAQPVRDPGGSVGACRGPGYRRADPARDALFRHALPGRNVRAACEYRLRAGSCRVEL